MDALEFRYSHVHPDGKTAWALALEVPLRGFHLAVLFDLPDGGDARKNAALVSMATFRLSPDPAIVAGSTWTNSNGRGFAIAGDASAIPLSLLLDPARELRPLLPALRVLFILTVLLDHGVGLVQVAGLGE